MNIPEEFGKYLLLKKLAEDSLGETFRAGRAGREGIDQVVLLRVFNGASLDGERLWQKVSGRAPIQQALRSPNIGSGVDLGKVRSFPYIAYDYISGKNLATLLAEAARQRLPVPPDHALLLVERLALALAAAYETRLHDERIVHGMVVPHLVMVSNEGEARLLGFEVAPGLRELYGAGWRPGDLTPYLAPEAATGPANKTDDVYSLAALLFELLTGHPLPAGSPEHLAAVVDGSVAAHDEAPFPQPVASLIKRSLLPRDQRIADAVTWHKAISKLMIEGQYSSTTFNLAFFMHNLFRDDIERESQEMQAEKHLELPQRVAAAPPPVAAVPEARPEAKPDFRETTGVRETTFPGSMAQVAGGTKKSRTPLFAGLGLVLAGLLVGAYFVFGRSAPKPAPAAAAVANATAAMNAEEAKKQQEALQAQMQSLIDARSKEVESKLKSEYDDKIKELQKRYDDTRKAAAASASPGESEPPRQRERSATATPSSAPPPSEVQRSAQREPSREAATPAETTTAAPAPSQAAAEKPAASVPDKPAAPIPAPAPVAQVQVGDLVSAGPGVVAPKQLSIPKPYYPNAAKRMNNPGAAVNLKILVDEHGRVLEATPIGAQAGLGFEESAIEAAKRAVYQPATKDGVPVKFWTTLHIIFPAGGR